MIIYNKEQYKDTRKKCVVDVKCPVCCCTFKCSRLLLQRALHAKRYKFCSSICAGKHRAIERLITNCVICNKEIVYKLNDKRKYCSTRCSAIDNNQKRSERARSINTFTCINCKKESYAAPGNISKRKFCSKKCAFNYKSTLDAVDEQNLTPIRIPKLGNICCAGCGATFKAKTRKSKFCSGTCRNKINNQNIKGSRSKAEKMLEKAITDKYPELFVLYNDRKTLSGLELDVFIPSINLAIEWNGVFHYNSVKGSLLEQYQTKDKIKLNLCKDKGIELLVIKDLTSHNKFIKSEIDKIIEVICKKITYY